MRTLRRSLRERQDRIGDIRKLLYCLAKPFLEMSIAVSVNQSNTKSAYDSRVTIG